MNSFVKGLALLCLLSNAASVSSQKLKEEEINVLIEKIHSREVNDTLKAVALGALITDSEDNTARAAGYVKQLYALTDSMADPKGFGIYFARTSDHYGLSGKYKDALAYARISMLILKKHGTTSEYLPAVDKVCVSLLAVNSVDELLALSSSILREYKDYPLGQEKAGVYSKRGTAYLKKKRYKNAISDFKKALEGYRKDGFTKGEFFTYNQISSCYIEMNELGQAEEYLLRILNHPIFKTWQWTNRALVYDKLAFIYLKMRKYPKALEYFKTAQANCPSDNLNLMKQIRANTAMALVFMHQTDEALATAEEVIGNGENMNQYRKRDAYYVAGLCYFEKHDYSKAKDRLTTAIKTAKIIDSVWMGNNHNIDVVADSKKKISLMELQNNNPEKSFALLEESYKEEQKKLAAAKDLELHKEVNTFELGEKKREVKNLTKEQLRNRLEIKEQEQKMLLLIGSLLLLLLIVGFIYRGYLIKKRNAQQMEEKKNIIEQQNVELEESLTERDVLLKEVHHRVKNNFQMVISLLRLQAEEGNAPDVDTFLEEATSRILSMSLIHQNLYQSENLSAVNFKEYVEELAHYIRHAFKGAQDDLQFNLDMPEVLFDIQTAIPLGLILNEMMLNTIKYVQGNVACVNITVALKVKDDESYELYYYDNGTKSQEHKEGDSFGSELITLLVHQIGGRLHIENSSNVSYKIMFSNL